MPCRRAITQPASSSGDRRSACQTGACDAGLRWTLEGKASRRALAPQRVRFRPTWRGFAASSHSSANRLVWSGRRDERSAASDALSAAAMAKASATTNGSSQARARAHQESRPPRLCFSNRQLPRPAATGPWIIVTSQVRAHTNSTTTCRLVTDDSSNMPKLVQILNS